MTPFLEIQCLGHIVSGPIICLAEGESDSRMGDPQELLWSPKFSALYHWRYAQGFATIAKTLIRLTEGSWRFQWNKYFLELFEKSKKEITSAPILGYLLPEGPFILDAGFSDVRTDFVIRIGKSQADLCALHNSETRKLFITKIILCLLFIVF